LSLTTVGLESSNATDDVSGPLRQSSDIGPNWSSAAASHDMSAHPLEAASPSGPSAQPDSSVPRKRRKRVPAAGAADDCFTCSTRHIKCDRRRPYCSQCLNDGKDCSGYKTQLTWGVGVASRGKLRGLSLPIAGTPKVAAAGPPSPQKIKKKRSGHGRQLPPPPALPPPLLGYGGPAAMPPPVMVSPDGTANFNFDNPITAPIKSAPYAPAASWHFPSTTSSFPGHATNPPVKVEPQDHRLASNSSIPPASPHETFSFPPSLNARTGYGGQHERISPMSYSAPSPDVSYMGPGMSQGSMAIPSPFPPYPGSPHFPSPFDAVFSDHGSFSIYPQPEESYVRNDGYEPAIPPFDPLLDHDGEDEQVEEIIPSMELDTECAVVDDVPPLPLDYRLARSPFSGMGVIGKTPRMQYLIKYYAEVISPVIVAFDGPSNPFRAQILRLAAESETLQHAISALSACNLRQRAETGAVSTGKTDPARRSSMAHLSLTTEEWHHTGPLSLQARAREERFHKGVAIQSLNQQLAHPTRRKEDSILATLLMLCLFHICDSGVAKFETQFAGVKKLLNLRQNDHGLDTEETTWFTRMFTWFDAMTASVNDRDGQLQGHHLDVSALSDQEWALENLTGCEGQLFRTIAKLGRLNVLSQGKPVESSPAIVSRPLPPMSFQSTDYSDFDGNGWRRIIADEDLFSSKTASSDVQTQFWREWWETRHALQTWRLDTSLFDSVSSQASLLTAEQRVDIANISESFRYSALLYTERLANPTVPSSDPRLQSWVRQSLRFIKQVKSDVFLLWPLFVTGSECVTDLDRAVIRDRCLDIQKDSGFLNNKSCLDLLEKVWARNNPGAGVVKEFPNASEMTGFRFIDIMREEGNEGEYIVV